jgi:hypothetical protein
MAGTVLRNGPANGMRTLVPMKKLTNQVMDNGSHLILADRSECLGCLWQHKPTAKRIPHSRRQRRSLPFVIFRQALRS